MILYHGSFLEVAKPDLLHSRPNVAVSYTHLDVYKRQAVHRSLWLIFKRNINFCESKISRF